MSEGETLLAPFFFSVHSIAVVPFIYLLLFFLYSALDLFWAMASLLLEFQDSRIFKT